MDPAASLTVARLGTVEYTAAMALQNALVAARMRDAIGDTLLLLDIHTLIPSGAPPTSATSSMRAPTFPSTASPAAARSPITDPAS